MLALQADHLGAAFDGYEIVFAFQAQFLKVSAQTQAAIVATSYKASARLHFQVLHLPRRFEDLGGGGAADSGQQAPQE